VIDSITTPPDSRRVAYHGFNDTPDPVLADQAIEFRDRPIAEHGGVGDDAAVPGVVRLQADAGDGGAILRHHARVVAAIDVRNGEPAGAAR
jgi:hypothetical protein